MFKDNSLVITNKGNIGYFISTEDNRLDIILYSIYFITGKYTNSIISIHHIRDTYCIDKCYSKDEYVKHSMRVVCKLKKR